MLNEQVVVNGKSSTNTLVALELVSKLKNLDLVQEFQEQSNLFSSLASQGASYQIMSSLANQRGQGGLNQPNALLTKPFTLSSSFGMNIIGMIGQDLKLNYLKKKSSDSKDMDILGQNERAKVKWERITHYMLNIDKI